MTDTIKTRLASAGLVLAALILAASCGGGADKSGGELLFDDDDPFYDFDEPLMEEGD